MDGLRRELVYVMVISAAALVLHTLSPLFPLVLMLPTLLTFTVTEPLAYLVVLAVASELASTQVAGISAAAVLLPYLARRLIRTEPVDVSVSWFITVLIIVFAQFIVLFAPTVWAAWQAGAYAPRAFAAALALAPWSRAGEVLLIVVVVYSASVLAYYNRSW